jgi:gluconolactonase
MAQTAPIRCPEARVIAAGLKYTEGPIYCSDNTVILCEIGAGRLTRVDVATGATSVVAQLGGGPNGAAVGPGGAIYVANNGGMLLIEVEGVDVAVAQAPVGYQGGSIQRVDPKTGSFTRLYSDFQAVNPLLQKPQMYPLSSPDDLVFDSKGGFWFTDWGNVLLAERVRTMTGLYYARPDGSSITEAVFPLTSPNGVDLSPDESRLYVAETYTRRVLFWELAQAGQIAKNPKTASGDGSYLLCSKLPGEGILDSMKVDAEGNVYVVTMLVYGNDPQTNGGITVISPSGDVLDFIEIRVPGQFTPLPSNLCFGGSDDKTMFVTTGGSGGLVAIQNSVPGRKLAYNI